MWLYYLLKTMSTVISWLPYKAMGLSIETAPTHVAGLPVAVNVSCHVTRRAAAEL